jgi:hypothetical protein
LLSVALSLGSLPVGVTHRLVTVEPGLSSTPLRDTAIARPSGPRAVCAGERRRSIEDRTPPLPVIPAPRTGIDRNRHTLATAIRLPGRPLRFTTQVGPSPAAQLWLLDDVSTSSPDWKFGNATDRVERRVFGNGMMPWKFPISLMTTTSQTRLSMTLKRSFTTRAELATNSMIGRSAG